MIVGFFMGRSAIRIVYVERDGDRPGSPAQPKNSADMELERLTGNYGERLRREVGKSLDQKREQDIRNYRELSREPLIRDSREALRRFKEKAEAVGLKVNQWVKEKIKSCPKIRKP